MSSLIDANHKRGNLNHFMVNTRTFQVEKCRNVAMYEHLHNYIKRQNEKKKQELEMSEELKRAKREKELKHRRNMLTLDEINQEIFKHRQRIRELETQKSKLFDEFKKVLNDEDKKKEKSGSPKEGMAMGHFGPLSGVNTPISQSPSQAPPPAASTATTTMTTSKPTSQTVPSSTPNQSAMNVPPQLPYFGQPPVAIVAPNSINFNPHRSRVPTPTGPSSSMPSVSKSQSSQPVFSKSVQPSQHQMSGVAMPLTSLSSQVVTSSPYQGVPNDRHRAQSYKRTHEQVSSVPMAGPVTSSAPHLPYLANLRQPQIQGLPPHAFHNLAPIDQYSMYQSFLNSMNMPNNPYINTNPK